MKSILDYTSKPPEVPIVGGQLMNAGASNIFGGGGGDPILDEMKLSMKRKMPFDNKNTIDIVRSAASRAKVNPSLLFSSAFQEGMNKAVFKPDEVSEAYINAEKAGLDTKTYPVDGFYNYGLDRFGEEYHRLKKYLPEGFESRFKPYKAKNEKGEEVTTSAFISNEDALLAKAAIIKDLQARIDEYAAKHKIQIDDADRDYFTLAAYNGGFENGKLMLNEYAKAKNKREFVDLGQTTRQAVHRNVSPRIKRMQTVNELFADVSTANTAKIE